MTLPKITLIIWGVGAAVMLGMKLALVGIPAQLGWIENALYPAIPFGISLTIMFAARWLMPDIEIVDYDWRIPKVTTKTVFRFSKEYREYQKKRK